MRVICGVIWSLVFTTAALAATADSASVERRFAEAQAVFDAAQAKIPASGGDTLDARRSFRDAAERFAALARDGVASVNLYVNTGNAYHFAGDDPRALLWYLRAASLANTAETRTGLATLRHACRAEVWPPPHQTIGRVLMSWHYDLGRRPKQLILLALYPVGAALIVISIFARRRRTWLRTGLALMIVGGLMGVSDVVAASAHHDDWAVVLESAKGLSGDGQMYSTVVEAIAPGQEVRLLESRPAWRQIELPSGTRCWVQAAQCEPVTLGPIEN